MSRVKFFWIFNLTLVLVASITLSRSAPVSALAIVTQGRLSPELQISSTQNPNAPFRTDVSAAYNSDLKEFLVMWTNVYQDGYRDISAQRIKSNGVKVGSLIIISTGPGNRVGAAAAYNPIDKRYLVVFMQDINNNLGNPRYDIKGQFVGGDGVLQGSPFTIQTWVNQTFYIPRIAFNDQRNEYMVVWNGYEGDFWGPSWIGLAILQSNGVIRFSTILTDVGDPNSPDIIWNTVQDNYLVVWDKTNASGYKAVMGCLLSSIGSRIVPGGVPAPGDITINSSTDYDSYSPSVAFSGGVYGVAFDYGTSPFQIYLSLITPDGATVITFPAETDTTGFMTNIAGNPQSSELEFLVEFQRYVAGHNQVWMKPISPYVPTTSQPVCAFTDNQCYPFDIVTGGAGFLILYTKLYPPPEHVYGRMFSVFNLNLPIVIK